jgi:hypothetical protein
MLWLLTESRNFDCFLTLFQPLPRIPKLLSAVSLATRIKEVSSLHTTLANFEPVDTEQIMADPQVPENRVIQAQGVIEQEHAQADAQEPAEVPTGPETLLEVNITLLIHLAFNFQAP